LTGGRHRCPPIVILLLPVVVTVQGGGHDAMAEGGDGGELMTLTTTTATTTAPLPLLGIGIFGLHCHWQQEPSGGGGEYNQTPHSLSRLVCGLRQTAKPVKKTTINLPKQLPRLFVWCIVLLWGAGDRGREGEDS
jgi:hypothetical protein